MNSFTDLMERLREWLFPKRYPQYDDYPADYSAPLDEKSLKIRRVKVAGILILVALVPLSLYVHDLKTTAAIRGPQSRPMNFGGQEAAAEPEDEVSRNLKELQTWIIDVERSAVTGNLKPKKTGTGSNPGTGFSGLGSISAEDEEETGAWGGYDYRPAVLTEFDKKETTQPSAEEPAPAEEDEEDLSPPPRSVYFDQPSGASGAPALTPTYSSPPADTLSANPYRRRTMEPRKLEPLEMEPYSE